MMQEGQCFTEVSQVYQAERKKGRIGVPLYPRKETVV